MDQFIAKYSQSIAGILSGFDRLVFRGTLRQLAFTSGVYKYLGIMNLMVKDFASHTSQMTQRIKQAWDSECQIMGIETRYLASAQTNKEGTDEQGRHTSSGSVFYTFDEHGNVAQRTDGSGSVVDTSLFDSFGTKLSTNTQSDPWGYGAQAGYYTDTETGLILCTHRYYDPSVGRWLNRDPIGYAGGINLYGYVGNGGVSRLDPSGFDYWTQLAGFNAFDYPGPPYDLRNPFEGWSDLAERQYCWKDRWVVYGHYSDSGVYLGFVVHHYGHWSNDCPRPCTWTAVNGSDQTIATTGGMPFIWYPILGGYSTGGNGQNGSETHQGYLPPAPTASPGTGGGVGSGL